MNNKSAFTSTGVLWILCAGLVVLSGALYASSRGREADFEKQLDELNTRYRHLSSEMNHFQNNEAAAQRALRVVLKNQKHLRDRYAKWFNKSHELQSETENVVIEASRAREMAEAEAEDIRRAARTRVQAVEEDLRRAESEKVEAIEREKAKQRQAQDTQRRLMELQNRLKTVEVRGKEYQEMMKEHDALQKEADTAVAGLQSANSRVAELSEQTATAHYNLGVLLAQQGNYVQAAKEFELSLSFNPHHAQAHYNLALLYDAYLDRQVESRGHYEEYLRLAPAATDAKDVQYRLFQMKLQDKAGLPKNFERQKID